jgi:putative transposase
MHTTAQPTIWDVPDDGWTLSEPILNECYPATPKGHRRVDRRRVLHGLIFRLRPGCQGHQRPTPFGDDSTVHRHFQHGCQSGLLARMWAVLVEAGDELGGVDWPWQAADTARGKARRGGDLVGRNPTARGQQGGSGAAWWKRQVVPWAPPALGRRSTTRSCWPPPLRPSW